MITDFGPLSRYWHVAVLSGTLKKKPLARTILGHTLVLFRDASGTAHALLDRCCHRNYPLSVGKLVAGGIQCGYHGWEFSPEGQCIRVPGLAPESNRPRGCVPRFPVLEQDGLIWVYPTADAPSPEHKPLRLPLRADPAYSEVLKDFGPMEASMDNVLDNFMDSLHPPFVHPGLIYSDTKRNPLEIEVRPYIHPDGHRGVEGAYFNEPPPTQGLIGKIFSDNSKTVVHEERYIAPAWFQVEFRLGTASHLLTSHVMVPETPTRTRMYMAIHIKSRVPKLFANVLSWALFTRLISQDIVTLERQQRVLDYAAHLPRASSELDYLSLTAVHFLRQIAEGKSQDTIDVKTQRYPAFI